MQRMQEESAGSLRTCRIEDTYFPAKAVRTWLGRLGVTTPIHEPGSPSREWLYRVIQREV